MTFLNIILVDKNLINVMKVYNYTHINSSGGKQYTLLLRHLVYSTIFNTL